MTKIRVKGRITMAGHFDVVLHMSEAEFDKLKDSEVEAEINDVVDWTNWLDNADILEVDVWELDEEGEK